MNSPKVYSPAYIAKTTFTGLGSGTLAIWISLLQDLEVYVRFTTAVCLMLIAIISLYKLIKHGDKPRDHKDP